MSCKPQFNCIVKISLNLAAVLYWIGTSAAIAIPAPFPSLRVVVNSDRDQPIQPDEALTLREAIALVNGTLSLDQLSPIEAAQVTALSESTSRIEFNLPASQTTIHLTELLPPLTNPGLVVDGTTQPGYGNPESTATDVAIPAPVVAIAPASGTEILRGLTIVANEITIRGLSLYGFTSRHRSTASTPPADIFISHPLLVADTNQHFEQFPLRQSETPPQGVVIESNWLGVQPDGTAPMLRSAFGVYAFNNVETTIQQNWITNHDGSGIITSVRADRLQVLDNVITNNGFAGMPDAIRLEGSIQNTQIRSNQISGNAGSGVFLFRPEGTVQIQDNQIDGNGRRLRRAAVYLMGSDHQVINNQISNQFGAGVAVTAYSQGNLAGREVSRRNRIQGNRFANLMGLSIDLITRLNLRVENFQDGDGANPPRDSGNRRQDTGNAAINAPRFLSREFFILDGQVTLDGTADAGSEVEIYRVQPGTENHAPLSEPLTTVQTDDAGHFSLTLTNLQPGERVSAIATDPRYGTSEPAPDAVIRSLTRN
jgi:parallel beta-helix repeat protein